MPIGNITISAGTTLGVIPASGAGISFLDPLYKYANLTLPFSPNDPGLQYTYDNSSLATNVFLYARFFNLLNEPSTGVLIDVGTAAFPITGAVGACLDPRDFGAKGDGVTDDTDAVQAALDKAAANYAAISSTISQKSRVLQTTQGGVAQKPGSASATLTLMFPKTTQIGTTIILGVDCFNWDGTPPIVLDSARNPYTQFVARNDGQHITYGFYATSSVAGTLTVTIQETSGHHNSFIIGTAAEVYQLVTPLTLDGTPASNFAGANVNTFNSGTVSAANNQDVIFSFLYVDGLNFPTANIPNPDDNGDEWVLATRSYLTAAGGSQEAILAYVETTISGAMSPTWFTSTPNSGAIGWTIAFKAASLTTVTTTAGPTVVCIPTGENCVVRYRSTDADFYGQYGPGMRCLTIDSGVTLSVDGSIILDKYQFDYVSTQFMNPAKQLTIQNPGNGAGTVIVTINGVDALGNPATEVITSPDGGNVTTSTFWSQVFTPVTSNVPVGGLNNRLIFAPGDSEIHSGQTQSIGWSFQVLPTTPFRITKRCNIIFNPPAPVNIFADAPTTRQYTITGLDASGNPLSETVSPQLGYQNTVHNFSAVYSITTPTNYVDGSIMSFGMGTNGGGGQANTFARMEEQDFEAWRPPDDFWIIENKNAFVPVSYPATPFTNTGNANSQNFASNFLDYGTTVVGAAALEGKRNSGIRLTGTGKIILNGDWFAQNSVLIGWTSPSTGFSLPFGTIGFARFVSCDNSIIDSLEIVTPYGPAVDWMHSENPVIQELFVHDGLGDDDAKGTLSGLGVGGVITIDFCRHPRVLNNRIINCLYGGIEDWACYRSQILDNYVDLCRFGYLYYDQSGEFGWYWCVNDITANNEISGNRMVNCHGGPGSGLGIGFGFFGGFGCGTNATGISLHDNIANGNDLDFESTANSIFRALYNNDFTTTQGSIIINGQQQVTNETPAGLINGINTTYTLAHAPVGNSLVLELNGLIQNTPADYQINGNTITFVTAPPAGTTMLASYSYLA